MRVVSWNMRKNKKAWKYFFESLDPDIALLQESSPLDKEYPANVISKNVKTSLNNSILFKHNLPSALPLEDQRNMGLIASQYQNEDENILLLSVYGNLSFTGELDYVLLQLIEDSIEAMRKNYNATDIIISGDFNMDRRMDENPTSSRFSKKGETRHADFFDGI